MIEVVMIVPPMRPRDVGIGVALEHILLQPADEAALYTHNRGEGESE